MSRLSVAYVGVLCLTSAHGISADEQPAAKHFDVEHASLLQAVEQPAISPDGTMVAFTAGGIHVASLADGGSHSLSWEGGEVSQLRWTADGRAVEFLADDARGVRQLWSFPIAGDPAPVTAERSNIKEYAWSPGRRRLAMVLEGPTKQLKSPSQSGTYVGDPIDVAFDGADIRTALLPFLDLTGISYSIDGDVEGLVTARFVNKPWNEVFERLLEGQGLGYSHQGQFVRVARLSTFEAERSRREPPAPIVITSEYFKREGVGYVGDEPDRLVVRFIETGAQVAIGGTPPDPSELAWSPDGRVLAFSGSGTRHRRGAISTDLFVVEPGVGPARALVASDGDEDQPAFTPDGSQVLYRTEANAAAWPVVTHRIAAARIRDGAIRNLTGSLDRTIGQLKAAAGSAWFLVEDRGAVRLVKLDLGHKRIDDVATPGYEIQAFDVGQNGEVVGVASSINAPPALFLFEHSRLRPVTQPNQAVVEDLDLPPVVRVRAKVPDGAEIEGFFLPPAVPEAGSHRPPGIVLLHGGPYSQHSDSFDPFWHLLSGAGYAVIAPNPRGSSGYGEAFGTAIRGSWGDEDSEDVLAFVDEVVNRGLVDPDRLAVVGWSYGGWLTNHLVTRTNRFRAAVSGASVSNLLGDYGVSDATSITEAEFGRPWESLEAQVRMSPLFRANRVETPILVLCGEKDLRTPLSHSEQWYQALRRLGVQTELVIYPGQGHSMDWPAQADSWRRSLAWFDRFLKEPAPSSRAALEADSGSLRGSQAP